MFTLVQFDNMKYYILPSKRVKVIQATNCIVKYRNGGKYNAEFIEKSDNVNSLLKLQGELENPKQPVSSSTPNKQQTSIISPNNFTFTLNSDSDGLRSFMDELTDLGPNSSNAGSENHNENIFGEISRNKNIQNTSKIDTEKTFHNSALSEEEIARNIRSRGENTANQQHDSCKNRDHLNGCDMELTDNVEQTNDDNIISNITQVILNDKSSSIENKSFSAEDDSSFCPEQSIENTTKDTSNTIDVSSIKEKSSILDEECSLNIQKLVVPVRQSKEGKSKKHFCPFCETLQTKFARHLLLKHKTEEEVRKLIYLPNKNSERRQIIDAIRKRGDFIHNTKPELNSGILIVSRQKQTKSKNFSEDYLCCKSCLGFFAKSTIRFHTAKCDKNRKKGQRNILCSSRRLTGFIHPIANKNLRRNIFPVLTDDDVARTIKYDELIIMYGNKLSERYTLHHQHDYIRTQLRMLGRLKLEMMKLENNIQEFKDIFHPQYFDKCVKCLRILAEWDESSGTFKVPFNAQFVSTLMKKCARKLRTECIKWQDHDRKKTVDDYLLLWEEEIPTLISKKAHNDQMDQRRRKKVVLPSKEDIKLLYNYLKNECCNCIEILDTKFSLDAYKLLTKCTLTFVQIFNRRRAGEIERLTLLDYKNKEVLNDNIDKELYRRLSDTTKEFAKQFTRLVIRGKLNRTVPVLLSPLSLDCIEKILKYRKLAGVPDDNEFIFCSLHKSRLSKPYLRACPLLKRFANDCGAVLPSALRGTQLRKHVATYTSMLNVEECLVDRLANFMGHHKDIHKTIYRVPVPIAEITDVSKLLMAAIGEDDEDDDCKGSDDNQNSDSSSDEEDNNSQQPSLGELSNDVEGNSLNENDTAFQLRNESEIIRRRKISSATKIKRTKWSDREKKAIAKYFGDLNKLPKLPSLSECKRAITKYKELQKRTPNHIFSYINNQRRRF